MKITAEGSALHVKPTWGAGRTLGTLENSKRISHQGYQRKSVRADSIAPTGRFTFQGGQALMSAEKKETSSENASPILKLQKGVKVEVE